jgi:hypothetical protein
MKINPMSGHLHQCSLPFDNLFLGLLKSGGVLPEERGAG